MSKMWVAFCCAIVLAGWPVGGFSIVRQNTTTLTARAVVGGSAVGDNTPITPNSGNGNSVQNQIPAQWLKDRSLTLKIRLYPKEEGLVSSAAFNFRLVSSNGASSYVSIPFFNPVKGISNVFVNGAVQSYPYVDMTSYFLDPSKVSPFFLTLLPSNVRDTLRNSFASHSNLIRVEYYLTAQFGNETVYLGSTQNPLTIKIGQEICSQSKVSSLSVSPLETGPARVQFINRGGVVQNIDVGLCVKGPEEFPPAYVPLGENAARMSAAPLAWFEFSAPETELKSPLHLVFTYSDINNNGLVDDYESSGVAISVAPYLTTPDNVSAILGAPPQLKPTAAYSAGSLDVANAKDLRFFWWDGQQWRLVGGTLDTENKTLSADISHFSIYGVFASNLSPSYRSLEKIITPASADGSLDEANFDGLNGKTFTIRIFDATGRLVRTLTNLDSWNGRNDFGSIVESGPYIYQIEVEGQTISGVIVVAK